jgi:hypothetical protein
VVVIDPCQGSGTTGRVALTLGASYLGNDKHRPPVKERLEMVPPATEAIKKWTADLDPLSKVTDLGDTDVQPTTSKATKVTSATTETSRQAPSTSVQPFSPLVNPATVEQLAKNLSFAVKARALVGPTTTTTTTTSAPLPAPQAPASVVRRVEESSPPDSPTHEELQDHSQVLSMSGLVADPEQTESQEVTLEATAPAREKGYPTNEVPDNLFTYIQKQADEHLALSRAIFEEEQAREVEVEVVEEDVEQPNKKGKRKSASDSKPRKRQSVAENLQQESFDYQRRADRAAKQKLIDNLATEIVALTQESNTARTLVESMVRNKKTSKKRINAAQEKASSASRKLQEAKKAFAKAKAQLDGAEEEAAGPPSPVV